MARHHRLEGRAGAVLRPGEADARRGREPAAHAVRRRHGEGRQRPRRGRHLPPDPGRRLLRRTGLPARRARGRPVLRRRRPGPRHLHRVRQLHDRLQVQRQEHPDEELPLPRRAARREGDGAEHRHARRAGCGRRLRRHHQVHQGEASLVRVHPDDHRRAGHLRRGRHRHPEAVAPDEGRGPPAGALGPSRLPVPHQLGVDPRSHRAGPLRRLQLRHRDHLVVPPRRGHPRRAGPLRQGQQRDGDAADRAHRR